MGLETILRPAPRSDRFLAVTCKKGFLWNGSGPPGLWMGNLEFKLGNSTGQGPFSRADFASNGNTPFYL